MRMKRYVKTEKIAKGFATCPNYIELNTYSVPEICM